MTLFEDLLAYEFLRNALLAGVLVAVVCAVLGVFLVLRGMSLFGDGLAHMSFGGVAVGLVAGVFPLATALLAAIAGSLAVYALRARRIVKGDTAIGILFTAGLALGILVVSASRGLASAHQYLFGNIIAVAPEDLAAIAVVGAALLGLLALFHREFVYLTFNEEAAKVSGLPVVALDVLFAVLTAAAIVVAARLTGVLLVSALIVVPAAAALQLGRGFAGTVAAGLALGLVSVVVGLALSVEFGTAPGATIATVNVAAFALVALGRGVAGARGAAA